MSKIDDLVNMDYNLLVQLSHGENIDSLRSIVKYMTTIANQRIRNLEKSEVGKLSPMLEKLHKAGVQKFSTKGISNMGTNDLMHNMSQLKTFLKAKTSTLKGWKEVRTQVAERTGAKKLFQREYKSERSAKIWQNREKRFWKMYNELVDNYGGIIDQLGSDRIQKMLMSIEKQYRFSKSKKDDVSDAMNTYIEYLYEENKKSNLMDTDIDLLEEDFLTSLADGDLDRYRV